MKEVNMTWLSHLLFILLTCTLSIHCSRRDYHEFNTLKHRNELLKREINHLKNEKRRYHQKTKLNLDHIYKRRKYNKHKVFGKSHIRANTFKRRKYNKKHNTKNIQQSKKFNFGYIENYNTSRVKNKMVPNANNMVNPMMPISNNMISPMQSYPNNVMIPNNMMGNLKPLNPAIMGTTVMKNLHPRIKKKKKELKVLDSVLVQETPKQSFQQNMTNFAQRQNQQDIQNERKL